MSMLLLVLWCAFGIDASVISRTASATPATEVFFDNTFVMNRFSLAWQSPNPITTNNVVWDPERLVGQAEIDPYTGSTNERVLQTWLAGYTANETTRLIFRRIGWTIRGDEQAASDTIRLEASMVHGSSSPITKLTIGLRQGANVFVPDALAAPNHALTHSGGLGFSLESTGDIAFSDFVCVNNPGAQLEFGPGTKIIKFGLFHELDPDTAGRALQTLFDSVEFTVTTNP